MRTPIYSMDYTKCIGYVQDTEAVEAGFVIEKHFHFPDHFRPLYPSRIAALKTFIRFGDEQLPDFKQLDDLFGGLNIRIPIRCCCEPGKIIGFVSYDDGRQAGMQLREIKNRRDFAFDSHGHNLTEIRKFSSFIEASDNCTL